MSQAFDSQQALLPSGVRKGLLALVVIGALTLAGGVAAHNQRVWSGFLVSFELIIGLGLAGALFLAIHAAAGARWATTFRKVPEAMAATLFVSSLLVLLLVWGAGSLYPWAQPGFMDAPELLGKKGWLSLGFFSFRAVAYVAAWTGLAWLLLRHYRGQDKPGAHRASATKLGIAFLIVFGYTFCLSAFDWVMSLEPTWSSTIFGLYCFAGVMQSGFAAMILLVLFLDSKDVFKGALREQHLHDLGKFLFAFSCFWAYMWFSQFMLTWFADLPDENQYYLLRSGPWGVMMALTVVGRFAVPFFGLASQSLKKRRKALACVALVVLAAHWLDLVELVMPSVAKQGLLVDPFDIVLPLSTAALFVLLFFRAFSGQRAVPAPDAALAYSQHYH